MADTVMPVISQWANAGHGLDALLNPWNVVLGLAVFFLARILGALYFINNINEDDLVRRCRRALWGNTALFLVFFLAFVIRTLRASLPNTRMVANSNITNTTMGNSDTRGDGAFFILNITLYYLIWWFRFLYYVTAGPSMMSDALLISGIDSGKCL